MEYIGAISFVVIILAFMFSDEIGEIISAIASRIKK